MAKLIFYTAFGLFYYIGGLLAFVGVPFRMAFVSPLALLLVPLYGLRLDKVTWLFLLMALVTVASGISNGSSGMQILLFFRFVITPFAMYYLAKVFLSPRNMNKVLNISIMLGMIQLPVVLFQRLSFDWLINYSAFPSGISQLDFNFGTFYVKDDSAMSFFLIGLILFLLFENKRNYFVSHRMFRAVWFSLSILVANSKVSHFMLIGIWAYYVLQGRSFKTLLQVGLITGVIAGIFTFFSWNKYWIDSSSHTVQEIIHQDTGNIETFLGGGYSRAAAILYYMNEPLSLLGDGPSRYYDPVSRTHIIGNTGHALIFYGEVGLIGLILSYWILYRIAVRRKGDSSDFTRLYFLVIVGLSATTSIMSDASIMLAFNIFMRSKLINRINE
ncbi:MAG: hypothetical protein IH948_10200 [Bacteroidetes bacterium]|nr:hypothetical protein [Bacteroidota bacterium]